MTFEGVGWKTFEKKILKPSKARKQIMIDKYHIGEFQLTSFVYIFSLAYLTNLFKNRLNIYQINRNLKEMIRKGKISFFRGIFGAKFRFQKLQICLAAEALIARRIVDVTNVRAKHYWIDIRTNSTRCR